MGSGPAARSETHDPSRSGWLQPHGSGPPLSPNSRAANVVPYSQQHRPSGPTGDPAFGGRQEQEAVKAALVHQQEQSGVSHLQNAVLAATDGMAGRTHVLHNAPGSNQMNSMLSPGIPGLMPGQPGDLKRGPVEFNHAISYVNKIKVSSSSWLFSSVPLLTVWAC